MRDVKVVTILSRDADEAQLTNEGPTPFQWDLDHRLFHGTRYCATETTEFESTLQKCVRL